MGIAALLLDLPATVARDMGGFSVEALSPSLLDPLRRLVRLLDTPEDMAFLRPIIEREILYRVLRGPQGSMLRHLVSPESRLSQVGRTITWMREHIDEPVTVGRLAKLAGMSATSYHRHFKAVTALSPLAYHKQIRLHEARRLLLAQPKRAAAVAVAVGYESASQFARECPSSDDLRRFGTLRNGGSGPSGWRG